MSVTINKANYTFQITRGDSCVILLRDPITKLPKVFALDDKIYFTVKDQVLGTQIFQKEITPDINGHITIEIEPADTKDEAFGSYVYDVQWESDAGQIVTLIPPRNRTRFIPIFEICPEVTLAGGGGP
jgi:hypothetical protein